MRKTISGLARGHGRLLRQRRVLVRRGRRAGRSVTPPAPSAPQAPVAVAAPPPVDPVQALLAAADRHFEDGPHGTDARPPGAREGRVQRGARSAARVAGGRADRRARPRAFRSPRRSHRRARAERAGHRRRLHRAAPTEPASIDELLAIATFDTAPTAATTENVQADLEQTTPRHSDSAQRARAAVRRAVSGPAARVPRGRAANAARSTCR